MSNCSGGCCNNGSCHKTSAGDCEKGEKKDGCCGGASGCNCAVELAVAQDKAKKDDGMWCGLCNNFCRYAEPNRCNGDFYCHKCKTDSSWKISRKGKWLS